MRSSKPGQLKVTFQFISEDTPTSITVVMFHLPRIGERININFPAIEKTYRGVVKNIIWFDISSVEIIIS